jgi:ABC-type branched-subunit amino acid transport system permease subunit
MKRLFTWLTASTATVIVGITAAATAMFVIANPTEVVSNLAPAVMAGVGTTLGAALGGLIVLRFKTVRTFVRDLIHKQDN